MLDALTSLLAFIVAISVLVAVHEFGHYIVGRWCGMKVLRFSIGFGKPIWMRVGGKDKTEYCIAAIPLGGYVKFLGERYGSGEPIDPADEGRAFNHRPVWNRIVVLLAGPAFNFLFAFVAYWIIFINGVARRVTGRRRWYRCWTTCSVTVRSRWNSRKRTAMCEPRPSTSGMTRHA